MGCDDVCGKHFREQETFSGKWWNKFREEEVERQSDEDIADDDEEDEDVGVV